MLIEDDLGEDEEEKRGIVLKKDKLKERDKKKVEKDIERIEDMIVESDEGKE